MKEKLDDLGSSEIFVMSNVLFSHIDNKNLEGRKECYLFENSMKNFIWRYIGL